jgi:thiol-disulfide isomerase/thioredoxin
MLNNVSINVRNEAEADNALEIMKKSPITIVLVFANWCPHCHSYMETWNKLKKLPNRAPMVEMDAASEEPGAKEAVQEFLSNIKGPDGFPMEVNAFPTVLSVKNNKGSLMAEPVENSRDENAMEEMLNNNAPQGSVVEAENMPNKKSPEEATKNVASMNIPIATAEESVRAANASLKASLNSTTRLAGLSGIPKGVTAKPAEISQAALNAESDKSNSRPISQEEEDEEGNNDNIYEEPVTPAFTEPPSAEVLDSGESEGSRKATAPGLAGGSRVGGSLYESLSTYAAGSSVLASLATAAAPAAILLAAQQTAARRARIGKPKPKTRKGGAKKRKTLKRK